MINPHETYGDNPGEQAREIRDIAWNEDAANGNFDAALGKLDDALNIDGLTIREKGQTEATRARVHWIVDEGDLAVLGIRDAAWLVRQQRKQASGMKRDQYEDHIRPWKAVIEATHGSRLRAVGSGVMGVLAAPLSEHPSFRTNVNETADRRKEVVSRLKKNAGALAIALFSFASREKSYKFAKDKFKPMPEETKRIIG